MTERVFLMQRREADDNPDLALMQAIASGDTTALQSLYEKHGLHLLNFLIARLGNRSLAEEVLQDVLLAVWQGAGRFRGRSQVRTWLFAIARRQAAKALRRKRVAQIPLEDATLPQSEGPVPNLEQAEEIEALVAAIDQLPPDQQAALELVFYREMSGPDAAAHLNIPLNTLKSKLYRARQNLRDILRQKGEDDD